LAKSIAELFKTLIAIMHSLHHRSKSLSCLQVFDEQRWLMGRGYVSLVVCIESQRGGKAKSYRLHKD
jgi:hypothetical protein